MNNQNEFKDERRHPDPVEWALLVDKVTRMSDILGGLSDELKRLAGSKCPNCTISTSLEGRVTELEEDKSDHEKRLRRIEEYVYKGVALAAVASPLIYFVLNKVWK
jgi:hypothetical protein